MKICPRCDNNFDGLDCKKCNLSTSSWYHFKGSGMSFWFKMKYSFPIYQYVIIINENMTSRIYNKCGNLLAILTKELSPKLTRTNIETILLLAP